MSVPSSTPAAVSRVVRAGAVIVGALLLGDGAAIAFQAQPSAPAALSTAAVFAPAVATSPARPTPMANLAKTVAQDVTISPSLRAAAQASHQDTSLAVTPAAVSPAAVRPADSAAPRSSGSTYVVNPNNAWAVLVGVGTYDAPTHPTYGGLGDVAAFHQLLDTAGWSNSHLLILTDQEATAANIVQAINWLVAHSSPTSFTLFHYSGHVLENSGGKYLWGVDNNFISDAQFGQLMAPLQGRAWIDIAGCESAAFNQGISSPDRFFTASSETDQKSYEDPSWGESIWTGLVADRGMDRDEAGPGPVSIEEAVVWAQQVAPQLTSSQQPYGPQVPYAVGGTGVWYLGPAMAPAAAPAPAPSPPTPTTAPVICALITIGPSNCP